MSDSTLTNPLLRTLREGGLAASLIVRLFDGPEIGRIAATAGLDALYVDLEHSPVAAIRQPHLQRHPRGGRDAAGARARHRRRADRPRAGRRRARHHRAAGRIGGRRGAGRGLLPPSAARPPFLRRRTGGAGLPRPAPGRGHGGPGRQRADGRHDRKPQRAGRGRGHRLGGRAGPAVHRRARPGGGPGPGRPMGPPALLRALARIRQACLDAGKALGLGGLAGQPALLRELAAPPLGCLVSTGTDLACLLGAATQRAAAHAARPAGANPSSSRTAARR